MEQKILDKIKWDYQPDMQREIIQMVRYCPPSEDSWQEARALLSGKQFGFEELHYLDDSGDTAYHASFDKESLAKVVSGIVYQAANGKGMIIRRFDRQDDGSYDLVMSQGSAVALKKLVPSMQLMGFTQSAGHVSGRE